MPVGTRAAWDPAARTVRCLDCADAPVASAPPVGAGLSAQREYQRRSARREANVRARHPRFASLLLALTEEPASTRVWAQGARGEQAVASCLADLDGVLSLHDRRRRRSDGRLARTNIDHLVVCAAGVWVIDTKTHGGRLEVRRSGGLLSPRVERLSIRGRDQTALLTGLAAQVHEVRHVLAGIAPGVGVRGALCLVGTELPWFGESIGGIPLVGLRGLARLLTRDGDLGAEAQTAVATYLDTRFPSA